MSNSRILHAIKKIWTPLFVLASFLFVGQYFYTQAGRIKFPSHFSPSLLAFAVTLQLCFWLANVLCWQKIVSSYAKRHISLVQAFAHIALLTLGKYLPGKVWGIVARTSLLKQEGVSLQQGVYATFYEQYLLLHASGLVCTAILCVLNPSVYTFAIAIAAIASIALIIPLQRIVFALLSRIMNSLNPRENNSTAQLPYWQMIQILIGYTLIWIILGLMFSCTYIYLFDKTLSLDVVMKLTLANTIGITLGFFALFAPGGLGIREAVTSGLLTHILPLEDGLMLSLVFRLWIVSSEIMSSLVLLVPKRNKKYTAN